MNVFFIHPGISLFKRGVLFFREVMGNGWVINKGEIPINSASRHIFGHLTVKVLFYPSSLKWDKIHPLSIYIYKYSKT